uniref:Uncharacterized protein n=1 Tax=Avena sativa TaxID=4498 RepID=A0ACD6A1B8_AVESA
MGMVCCHIIKVMTELRLLEIPRRHIMKRWTQDARDILPDHLKHYQKDVGLHETQTFRHSKMYIIALELVKMGDMNVAAYDTVMTCLMEAKQKVTPLCDKTDGMSIVEKAASTANSNGWSALNPGANILESSMAKSNGHSLVRTTPVLRTETEVCSRVGPKESGKLAMSEGSCANEEDESSETLNDVYSPDRSHCELAPPPGKERRGRPTTARDKAPYEKKGKRSRFCTIYRKEGHKCTTCPDRGMLQQSLVKQEGATTVVLQVIGRIVV